MYKLLIHGGASNQLVSTANDLKREATDRTIKKMQLSGVSALDMVEIAVNAQEQEEHLNAGIGSVVQMDGRVRMDAGICDSNGKYGAVVQIEHVGSPINVARRILDLGYHSILSGDGARMFAAEQGFPSIAPHTTATMEEYIRARTRYKELSYAALSGNIDDINVRKLSTVGAVAIDDKGNLAAACSTGGTKFCYPGRVGDTAFFGAGLYCSKKVAVACTGEGDKILRRLTAQRVERYYEKSGSLKQAADEAIQDLMEHEKGYGGIIAIAHTGETAVSYTTAFMAHASKFA